MSKESITLDDLTNYLSVIKKEQVELIQKYPTMYGGQFELGRFNGKLEVLMYLFHFLGLATEEELEIIKAEILIKMNEEMRKAKCQI